MVHGEAVGEVVGNASSYYCIIDTEISCFDCRRVGVRSADSINAIPRQAANQELRSENHDLLTRWCFPYGSAAHPQGAETSNAKTY